MTMATIKTRFRLSSVPTKEGALYFQVIHNRMVRQLKTDYRLFVHEWDDKAKQILCPSPADERTEYLSSLQALVARDRRRLERIVAALENKGVPYTSDDVVSAYRNSVKGQVTFCLFMREMIFELHRLGKVRTSETYAATLKSFLRFRKGDDLLFGEMDADMMVAYEAHLKERGVSKNTSSFYMRILRAVYNRAVEKGLTELHNPFRRVYTGVDKTVKRAISLTAIRRIRDLELKENPTLDFVRDMFLFSFYTRGMSFVDMAYLKKKDVQNGFLTYRRKKTGQLLVIQWEKCMQKIVDKYIASDSPYLLPLIRLVGNEWRQYKNASHLVNRKLKAIGEMIDLSAPLTMYVARHSWASVARSKNIPVSVICEGMGHDSENTTKIYLASLDTSVVDRANHLILKSL